MPAEQHPWWLVPVIQGAGQVITWLIVLIGWIVVNRQNNSRERRKETRTAADRLKERIEKLEQKAIAFHCLAFDLSEARDILCEIQRVSQATIRTGLLSETQQKRLTRQLRCSITLKNFDATTHQQLLVTNPLLDEISCAADDLIEAIEDGFSRKFL